MRGIDQIGSKGGNGRRTDHAVDSWEFLASPLVVVFVDRPEQTYEWLDRCFSMELAERTPGVDRCPDFQTVRVLIVQLLVRCHANEIRDVLRAKPKLQIVGPLGQFPAITKREQLIYGRRVSIGSHMNLWRSDSYWPSPLALLPHTSE